MKTLIWIRDNPDKIQHVIDFDKKPVVDKLDQQPLVLDKIIEIASDDDDDESNDQQPKEPA